ncbi:Flp pilus assembly protein TadG [Marmoricola sp. OAE513]|uniref:TadE/TadG family type IV pilus assembly protein n=1 Tax=Marmoricola sp. OAE513 TaxID=2817894 RepID=UPI001AE5AB5C
MSTWGSGKRTERGAAAVETALCICFLVLPLVFATISYAYMLSFRQSLSQAAAEGARAAAVAPAGTSQAAAEAVAKSAVDDALEGVAGNLACGTSNLTCTFTWKTTGCGNDVNGNALKCLSVKVSYPYRDHSLMPTVPGFGFLLPDTLAYSATAQVG